MANESVTDATIHNIPNILTASTSRELLRTHKDAHNALFGIFDRLLGRDVRLAEVLRDVAAVLCDDFHAERATVYVVDEQTRRLESIAVVGNVAQRIAVPISPTSLAGYCATSGRSFCVSDAYGDLSAIDARLRFDRSWDEQNSFRTRDVLCSPAVFKDAVVGVVQVINSRGSTFSECDLPALQSIGRIIGYALHYATLYEDLATLKRLEQEKAGFIRVMVHELKSPVAGAKMLMELLGEHVGGNEAAARLHGRIEQRMDDMLELTSDMLALAKVKSGSPMGEIGEVDLAAMAAEVAESYREQAETKGLAMDVALAGAVSVRIDRQALRLVVSNLVSNAVKYTPDGRVEVRLTAEEGQAVLAVADTGMGIPSADLPNMFREFFRASNARKSKIAGTGVGLAGIKSIVERFDGQLAVDSTEGEGSTFIVRLPLAATADGAYVSEISEISKNTPADAHSDNR